MQPTRLRLACLRHTVSTSASSRVVRPVGVAGNEARRRTNARIRASSSRPQSTTAAAVVAADVLVSAWATRRWITELADYPAAPSNVGDLYVVHLEMARHPLAESALGGLAGYKIGAVGAEGQPCIYAPLFRRFVVDEADCCSTGGALTSSSVQMHQVEPEITLLLGEDLNAKADGSPHSASDVWAAVKEVALSIECCGQRGSAEVMAQQPRLGKFQDALAAGGLVLGRRLLPNKERGGVSVSVESLASCSTELLINGKVVATGSAGNCPAGGPVEATVFLANELNRRGLALQRGQVVATGQTCMSREFAVGDTVEARFVELGGKVSMVVEP